MKKVLVPTCFVLLSIFNLCCSRESIPKELSSPPKDPNILIIISDDQGWGDVAWHGNKDIITPNLASLASQSYCLERFYVSPLCAPTRASLLTGRYHLRTGVHGVTGRKEVMRNAELTLSELFRDHDYTTSYFGKWHNGAEFPFNPKGQGFDHFYGFSGGHLNNYFESKLEWNEKSVNATGYITDNLTDSAIAEIKKNKNIPFLQVVSYNVPHSPFQVPDPYFQKYKQIGMDDETACIYGMVENMDYNIGRLLRTLDEVNISEKTIVFYMSDNGPNTRRYNGNLKGIKGSVDEGGIKVPCILKVPWMNKESVQITDMTAHIDIMPTLSELAGIDLPQGLPIDGVSMVPILRGENPYAERLFFSNRGSGSYYPFALRTSDFLLTFDEKGTFLYDLKADPGQKTNIGANYKEEVENWIKTYERWYDDVTRFGLEPPPVEIGHPASKRTELLAPESDFTEKVRFMEGHGWANDWLTNFGQPGDTIEWKLKVRTPGTYLLKLLLFSSHENTGQNLVIIQNRIKSEFTLDKEYVTENIPSPDRVPRKEAFERFWPVWEMGEIYMEKGEYPLRLVPAGKGLSKGLEIKSLILELKNAER